MSFGFSLIEVLISLLILSFILLGFDVMQIHALRQNRESYYLSIAENQLISMIEQLRVLGEDNKKQITNWISENQRVLPEGRGNVKGQYPNYIVTLFWGEKTNLETCKELPLGKLHCLTETVISS